MKIAKLAAGRWKLDGYSKGERIRKLFDTRDQAEVASRQYEIESFNHKHGIKPLTDHQIAVATEAFKRLPEGTDLLDIVNQWLSRRKVSNQCELQHAIVLFRSHLFKRNKRERYVDALHKTLNKFMRHFGEQGATRLVSDISRIDVTGFLDTAIKQTPVNRYNHIRDLGIFFNWAEEEKMIAENPVSDIKRPTVDRREPEVLTFKQAKAMLKNATGQDLTYAAIGMFAGVRPEEICRMSWSMVDLDHSRIRIPGSITKTRIGRTIDLEPNAVAWLSTVAQKEGPVFDGDSSCLIGRLKLAAGLKRWPQDVLRHTFASYHVCAFKDAAKTSLHLHDRRGTEVLFRHYFRDTLVEDAKKFWSLLPTE